jgi:hypothetical protein
MLSLFSFVVIFRGRPIPGEGGSPQELEFKGIKLKSNVVVMLLTVSAIVAIVPLVLQYLQSSKAQELALRQPVDSKPPAPPPQPVKSPELLISLTGQVRDNKDPIEGARVTVFNLKNLKPGDPPLEVTHAETDLTGNYDISEFPLGEGDRYKLVAGKEGFLPQTVHIGPGGGLRLTTVLTAKKAQGGSRP